MAITDAIKDDALAFIACFSQNSEGRGTTYQREELVLAVEEMRGRPLGAVWFVPVRFDQCKVPDYPLGAGRTVNNLNHLDLLITTGTGSRGSLKDCGRSLSQRLNRARPTCR